MAQEPQEKPRGLRGSVFYLMLLRSGCVSIWAWAGAARGSVYASSPGSTSCEETLVPYPVPNPTPIGALRPASCRSPPCPPVRVCASVHLLPVGRSVPLTCPAASRPRQLASCSPAGAAAFIVARSTRAAAHSCGRGSYTLTRCRRQQGF